jgi:hypothetical protein
MSTEGSPGLEEGKLKKQGSGHRSFQRFGVEIEQDLAVCKKGSIIGGNILKGIPFYTVEDVVQVGGHGKVLKLRKDVSYSLSSSFETSKQTNTPEKANGQR